MECATGYFVISPVTVGVFDDDNSAYLNGSSCENGWMHAFYFSPANIVCSSIFPIRFWNRSLNSKKKWHHRLQILLPKRSCWLGGGGVGEKCYKQPMLTTNIFMFTAWVSLFTASLTFIIPNCQIGSAFFLSRKNPPIVALCPTAL